LYVHAKLLSGDVNLKEFGELISNCMGAEIGDDVKSLHDFVMRSSIAADTRRCHEHIAIGVANCEYLMMSLRRGWPAVPDGRESTKGVRTDGTHENPE
jgi:hypothetical protein